jgi:hypothetical protein
LEDEIGQGRETPGKDVADRVVESLRYAGRLVWTVSGNRGKI